MTQDGAAARVADANPGVIDTSFVFVEAPFRQCHSATIVEVDDGLACAWFGGTHESHEDVAIWMSRRQHGAAWSAPVVAARGWGPAGERRPCWNPVLFQAASGLLLLFYKVGPDPVRWWGMIAASRDGGRTWTEPRALPDGIFGPIRNKPIQLPDGDLLCPSSTQDQGWRVHFERTSDEGRTWARTDPVPAAGFEAIQPALLRHPDGRLQAICRSRQSRLVESWSEDGGQTWRGLAPLELPNPNASADAVTLHDGRHLLVYNHTVKGGPSPRRRERLNVAISEDGRRWYAGFVLEAQAGAEFSYPAVIQARTGLVHAAYTWQRRRIRVVTIDPARLTLRAMWGGRWPPDG